VQEREEDKDLEARKIKPVNNRAVREGSPISQFLSYVNYACFARDLPKWHNFSVLVKRPVIVILILDFHCGMNNGFWFWGFCRVCKVNLPTTFWEPTAVPETSSVNLPCTP
jgi:hypothetical protein